MLPELTDEEMLRYNRQIVLRGFDFDGQERLKASQALIVGLGGLGCAAAPYLASAGVGRLTLLDFDSVSHSNLQRQILHHDADIGRAKVESAAQSLAAINPHCQLQISVFNWQPGTPCYRCISRLFGEQTLSCVEAGVMAPLVGVIGAMQAMEAIKLLADYGTPATSRLLMYDALSAEFRSMKVAQDAQCEVCGAQHR
jgi:adenylyltransferase/sulfurtransferase